MKKLNSFLTIMAGLPGLLACSAIVTSTNEDAMPSQPMFKIAHAAKTSNHFYELGRHHQRLRHWDQAAEAYLQALEIEPEHLNARNNLATVYASQNNYRNAIAEFNTVLKSAPANATGHNNLGYVLYLSQEYADAIPAFQKAIALEPANIRFYNNLAAAYMQSGQQEKSRQTLAYVDELSASRNFASDRNAAKFVDDNLRPVNPSQLISQAGAIWDLGASNNMAIVSLRSVDGDASALVLHGPDDLVLKVDQGLRTVPMTDAIQWKVSSASEEAIQYNAATPLRLKSDRRFAWQPEQRIAEISNTITSLDLGNTGNTGNTSAISSTLAQQSGDAVMLKMEQRIAELPVPGVLQWQKITTDYDRLHQNSDPALRLKMSMPLAFARGEINEGLMRNARASKPELAASFRNKYYFPEVHMVAHAKS